MARDGYETILANDGEKGLSYAGRYMPDLILLDRLMPKLNGLQVCRKLKEQESTRHIPIVFLTILDSEQDIIEGLKAGADDYITKPFSPDELSVRIERVLFRSVRSAIEDLLDETKVPVTLRSYFDSLIDKLIKTENNLREKLRKNMTTLKKLGQNCAALFQDLQISGGQDAEEGLSLILRGRITVKRYTTYFSQTSRNYALLRWLVMLIYRLEQNLNIEFMAENESARTLKRTYAELTFIMQKIQTVQRILRKTDRFLQKREEELQRGRSQSER
jgi:CheY-like chemotaxis protein